MSKQNLPEKSPVVKSRSVVETYELLQSADSNGQLPLPPAPRLCNTGVQFTTSKIDWLEFTVKGVTPDYSISEYLSLKTDIFNPLDFGMHGYTDCQVYGMVKVLFSPAKPERGTKIILSSQALDEVGLDALVIISRVLRDGGTFARLDIAMDDRAGLLDVGRFYAAEMAGLSVTHYKQVEERKPWNRHACSLAGHSVVYGSRSSARYLRIYDKRLEQINTGKEDPGQWVRVELQANKTAAFSVASELTDKGMASIPGIIAGAVDFRQTDLTEKNSSRCARLDWWAAFLGSCKPIKTGIKKAIKTVAKKYEWLARQCKKAIGQVAFGYGPGAIADLLEDGIKTTCPKEWAVLFPNGEHANIQELKGNFLPIPF